MTQGRRRGKPAKPRDEMLLCDIFWRLYGRVDYYEWSAIRAQMEVAFRRRRLPVDTMIYRLEQDSAYADTDWHDGEPLAF